MWIVDDLHKRLHSDNIAVEAGILKHATRLIDGGDDLVYGSHAARDRLVAYDHSVDGAPVALHSINQLLSLRRGVRNVEDTSNHLHAVRCGCSKHSVDLIAIDAIAANKAVVGKACEISVDLLLTLAGTVAAVRRVGDSIAEGALRCT